MAEDDLGDGEGAEEAGGDSGALGDGDGGVGDGLGNGLPGGDGGGSEGAVVQVALGLDDTGVGRGEQDEQCRGDEDAEHAADGLSNPLLDGRGAKQESNPEVAGEIGSDTGGATSNTGCDDVDALGVGQSEASARGGATNNELGGFAGGCERRRVGNGSDLDSQEGEDEG